MSTNPQHPARRTEHPAEDRGNETGGWTLVHEQVRVVLDEAVTEVRAVAADRVPGTRALVPWWLSFSRTFAHHMHAEDERIWPVLRVSDPASAEHLRALTAEHRAIEPLLQSVDVGIAALPAVLKSTRLAAAREAVAEDLVALQHAVLDHLEHEEATAVVTGRDRVSETDWARIEQDLVRGLTLRDVATLMPRILQNADAAGRARMLGRVPPPLRLVVTGVFEPRYRAKLRALPSHPRLPY